MIALRVSVFRMVITSWDADVADRVYSPAGSVVLCTVNWNGIVAVALVCAESPLAPNSASAPTLSMMVFNVFILLSPLLSSNGFWWITSRIEASALPNPERSHGLVQDRKSTRLNSSHL